PPPPHHAVHPERRRGQYQIHPPLTERHLRCCDARHAKSPKASLRTHQSLPNQDGGEKMLLPKLMITTTSKALPHLDETPPRGRAASLLLPLAPPLDDDGGNIPMAGRD